MSDPSLVNAGSKLPSIGLTRIDGARRHNVKNLGFDIRTGETMVVSGPMPGRCRLCCRA